MAAGGCGKEGCICEAGDAALFKAAALILGVNAQEGAAVGEFTGKLSLDEDGQPIFEVTINGIAEDENGRGLFGIAAQVGPEADIQEALDAFAF